MIKQSLIKLGSGDATSENIQKAFAQCLNRPMDTQWGPNMGHENSPNRKINAIELTETCLCFTIHSLEIAA